MKYYLLALSMASLSVTAQEYETSVGLGHQFGGVLGVQYAYKTESSKYFAALGLVGFAAGFQTTVSENSKHTLGLVAGREEFRGEDGFAFLTYDYHPQGFNNKGWVFGTGFGVSREDEGSWLFDKGNTETSTILTINIGYKF